MLSAAADDRRRDIGPYAWIVLEHLAARADPMSSDTVIETSIRDIAAHLAISKDTVTRALQRLIDAGLVDRHVDRDGTTGQFGNASYRLHLERAGLRVAFDVDDPADRVSRAQESMASALPRPRTAAKRARPRRPVNAQTKGTQLSLLDGFEERGT